LISEKRIDFSLRNVSETDVSYRALTYRQERRSQIRDKDHSRKSTIFDSHRTRKPLQPALKHRTLKRTSTGISHSYRERSRIQSTREQRKEKPTI